MKSNKEKKSYFNFHKESISSYLSSRPLLVIGKANLSIDS